MGNLRQLRPYVRHEDVKHVTFKKLERTQLFKCQTCGDLPVIGGVVIHTKPDEDHDIFD